VKSCELLTKRCHEDRQHTEISIVRKATIYAKAAFANKRMLVFSTSLSIKQRGCSVWNKPFKNEQSSLAEGLLVFN
jgi:hypothetical protein